MLGTSNPATHFRSAGGVARNVAHLLSQLGNRVELISHFGTDADGKWLQGQCTSAGIGFSHSHFSKAGTARFTAIIAPGGELFAGASDSLCEQEITISFLSEKTSLLESASLVVLDCNLSVPCLEWLLDFCRTHAVPCVIDPVSVAKASRLNGLNLERVLLMTPNILELKALTGNRRSTDPTSPVKQLLKRGVQKIWLRKGKDGSVFYSQGETISLPAPDVEVLDTTGAGDAALAGWIHNWLQNKSEQDCLDSGTHLAEMILQTRGAHSHTIDLPRFEMNCIYGGIP